MAEPYVVQFPSGHVATFPASMSPADLSSAASSVWEQLKSAGVTLGREGKAAAKSVVDLPSSLYHAASDPETPDESARYGKGFESKIGPTGRVIDRTAVQPILNAIEDYKNGKVGIDDVLQHLPEALGGAAGTVIAGKTAGDVIESAKAPARSSATSPSQVAVSPSDGIIESSGRNETNSPYARATAEIGKSAPKSELDDLAENFVKAHTADLKSSVSKGKVVNVHSVDATDPQSGRSLGNVTLTEEPGSGETRVAQSTSNLKPGSGLGTRMYRQAIHDALSRGNDTFRSDGVVSPSAQGVWQNLKDAGYPVDETAGKGGSQFSIDLNKLRPSTTPSDIDVTDDMNNAMTPVKVEAEPDSTAGSAIAASDAPPEVDMPVSPLASALSSAEPTIAPRMASPRDYLDTPQVDAGLNELYSKAARSYNDRTNQSEQLFAFDKDGNVTVRSVTDPNSGKVREAQASVPRDSQMIVHSHPASGQVTPSPGDYDTATKLGKPHFIVSRNAIYVAMPGMDRNTSKHVQVADIEQKHGKIVYKWK